MLGAYDWTNFMTAPEPHLFALVGAMSQNPALADDFTENFNRPELQWARLQIRGGDGGIHRRAHSGRRMRE